MTNGDDVDAPIEQVETPEQTDVYTFSYEHDRLIASLVEAVAWVKSVEPTELEPLYSVIETTALEKLYRSPPEKRPTVIFAYGGCTIRITPDSTITVRPHAGALTDVRERSSNILVYDMPNPQYNDEVCADLLSVESYSDENVLYVTFANDGDSACTIQPGTGPANLGVVSVGDIARSTARKGSTSESGPDAPQIATVPDPIDLGALGVRISEFLSAWTENDHQTVVCFRSLDDLLAQVDLAAAFRFLSLLTHRIDASDAIAHYHLDATTHEPKTVAMLECLFDLVIEHDQVEGWTSQSANPVRRSR